MWPVFWLNVWWDRIKSELMTTSPESPFTQRYRGAFYGVLRWEHLDGLWERLRQSADTGWYVYQVGDTVPDTPADAARLKAVLAEIDELLRREHKEDYCGIVYADNLQEPTIVKVYDPNNLGVVCGFSENPPLPGWVLSTLAPDELKQTAPLGEGRRRWWQRLMRRS